MTTGAMSPADRASFDAALDAVLSDHETLRRLAAVASKTGYSADTALSLAEAMAIHENAEARLFALPYLTRPPETVTGTAARAHRRRLEYLSGDFHLPEPRVAAALFIEALLAHLAVEDTWLAHEREEHHERLLTSI